MGWPPVVDAAAASSFVCKNAEASGCFDTRTVELSPAESTACSGRGPAGNDQPLLYNLNYMTVAEAACDVAEVVAYCDAVLQTVQGKTETSDQKTAAAAFLALKASAVLLDAAAYNTASAGFPVDAAVVPDGFAPVA